MENNGQKKNDSIFITFLAALFVFPGLFIFRSADDNRLFSWQWIFDTVNPAAVFLILLPGLAAAYALAKTSFVERNPRAFLFFLSFAAAACLWSEPELIIDASRYFTQAKHLELHGINYFMSQWGKDIAAWTDMPVVPFLYGLIFKLFGEHRIYIQVFVTLLFSMTLILTYLIGKTLWSDEIGLYAGALLLGMPYLLTQAPLMLVDVPTMFFLTLSVFAFIKALDRGGAGTILLSSGALFFTVFSKYSTWPMLSVFCVIFAVYLKREPKIILRRCFAVVLLTSLFVGAVAVWKIDVLSGQIGLLLNYQKPGLARWGESFVSTFLFQIHPFITVAAVYSLFVAFKKKDAKYAIISWLVLLVVVFGIRRIRYILPVFPFLALMASYGLQKIERADVKKFIVFSAVFSSLVMAFFAYLPFARNISASNLKNAGEYLNSKAVTVAEVFTPPLKDPVLNPSVAVPLLDLFTEKKIHYLYVVDPFASSKEVETSPLRFTWEYKNPGYYKTNAGQQKNTAVVIISGEADQVMPEHLKNKLRGGYRERKSFHRAADPFRFKTYVDIYIF